MLKNANTPNSNSFEPTNYLTVEKVNTDNDSMDQKDDEDELDQKDDEDELDQKDDEDELVTIE